MKSNGFTLIEMLVVVAIIGILAALMMPGLHKALESGRQIACLNNERQICFATHYYVEDFNGYWPNAANYLGTTSFFVKITSCEYLKQGKDQYRFSLELECPSNPIGPKYGRTYLPVLGNSAANICVFGRSDVLQWVKISSVAQPSKTATMVETSYDHSGQHFTYLYYTTLNDGRHSMVPVHLKDRFYDNIHLNYSNVPYVDNHVESKVCWQDLSDEFKIYK